MIDAMKKDLAERIGKSARGEKVYLSIAHTQNEELARDFREEIKKDFPEHDIYIAPLSLSVACHIGPGALAVTCSKYVPELDS